MVLWTEWWFWVSAALVLAILEVIVPGFFALGFAIGALIVNHASVLSTEGSSGRHLRNGLWPESVSLCLQLLMVCLDARAHF